LNRSVFSEHTREAGVELLALELPSLQAGGKRTRVLQADAGDVGVVVREIQPLPELQQNIAKLLADGLGGGDGAEHVLAAEVEVMLVGDALAQGKSVIAAHVGHGVLERQGLGAELVQRRAEVGMLLALQVVRRSGRGGEKRDDECKMRNNLSTKMEHVGSQAMRICEQWSDVRLAEDLVNEAGLFRGAVNRGLGERRLGLLLEAHQRSLDNIEVRGGFGLGDAKKTRDGVGEPLALQAGLLGSRYRVHSFANKTCRERGKENTQRHKWVNKMSRQ
jgi:hypothetical protein